MAVGNRLGDVVLGLGCAATGVVLPVALGLDPALTVAVLALGVVAGVATGPLVGGRKLAAFFALLATGVVVLGSLDRTESGGSWIAGMVLGAVLGTVLTGRAERGRRRGPTTAVRVRWDHGPETVEPDTPSTADLLDAVRALDGRGRTVVSIARGHARLDIGGDAGGPLLVLYCADVGARLPRWQALSSGPHEQSGGEVAVRIAGTDGRVPASATTTLGRALEAVEHVAAGGTPAPAHELRGGMQVADLRPPALDASGDL